MLRNSPESAFGMKASDQPSAEMKELACLYMNICLCIERDICVCLYIYTSFFPPPPLARELPNGFGLTWCCGYQNASVAFQDLCDALLSLGRSRRGVTSGGL